MKKVRVAIVGCKNMGRKHLAVLQKYFADKVKIAGILNSTAEFYGQSCFRTSGSGFYGA